MHVSLDMTLSRMGRLGVSDQEPYLLGFQTKIPICWGLRPRSLSVGVSDQDPYLSVGVSDQDPYLLGFQTKSPICWGFGPGLIKLTI